MTPFNPSMMQDLYQYLENQQNLKPLHHTLLYIRYLCRICIQYRYRSLWHENTAKWGDDVGSV